MTATYQIDENIEAYLLLKTITQNTGSVGHLHPFK